MLSSRWCAFHLQGFHLILRFKAAVLTGVCTGTGNESLNMTKFIAKPSDTLAGTADWLIQNDTQDMATSRIEGM